jgi:hypothetical protein
MINHLHKIIQQSSWQKTALLTAILAAFYALINFSSIGVAGLLRITGGASTLDLEFGYSYAKAYDMLTALGAEGRAFYLTKLLPLDFPFPIAYMLFGIACLSLLIKHLKPKTPYKYLLFLPVSAMLSDWVENIGIIAMLNSYPNLPGWAVVLASVFGMLKTVLVVGSIAAIVVLFIVFLNTLRLASKPPAIQRYEELP